MRETLQFTDEEIATMAHVLSLVDQHALANALYGAGLNTCHTIPLLERIGANVKFYVEQISNIEKSTQSGAKTTQAGRDHFRDLLADAVRARGAEFIAANFGRGPQNESIWGLTFSSAAGNSRHVRVVLDPGIEPYSRAAVNIVSAAANAEPPEGWERFLNTHL